VKFQFGSLIVILLSGPGEFLQFMSILAKQREKMCQKSSRNSFLFQKNVSDAKESRRPFSASLTSVIVL
jgi:hypothetical protein